MSLSKTRQWGKRIEEALYDDILMKTVAPCVTWPARMPPYCYTELCPDARYQTKFRKEKSNSDGESEHERNFVQRKTD